MKRQIVRRDAEEFRSKEPLARHIGEPHDGPDGRTRSVATPLDQRMRWRMDELVNSHRDLHAAGYRDEPDPE